MDLKTHILRWEHAIEENHAILVLVIFAFIAAIFVIAVLVDGFFKFRRLSKRRRK